MKKSLFKKPAWSNTRPSTANEDNDDLFRQSDETYTKVVADKQRRKAERKERERLEKEAKEAEVASRAKRRKTSESDGVEVGESKEEKEDKRSMSLGREPELDGDKIGRVDGASRRIPLLVSHSDSGELHSPASIHSAFEESKAGVVVDLEDLDDPEVDAVTVSELVPVEDEDSEQDEEFKELKRKAREKARLQNLGIYRASPGLESRSNSQQISSQGDGSRSNGPSQMPPRPPSPDPVLQIFITSPIENTKALIVQRKLSQALREVRKAYCEKQKFPPEFAERTFFVYRGIRTFDTTACKNLGIHVEPDGSISDGGGGLSSIEGHRINMELVTTEIFETQRREKARHLSADIDEDDEQIEEQGPKKDAEPDIRLFLKSKGLEEVKITVKPSTTVARLIAVFRSQRNIGEEKAVALVFDGDRLASGSTAADNDLDDMDSIEVHIK
jgi:Ubiquitin-2 like Rad60 SUMO-like